MSHTVATRYGHPIRRTARQSWQIGDTVKVGFVSGLEVVKKIATPGDHKPDAYVLWQASTNRFYQFVPHNGLVRCDSLAQAMAI
jgi:hypothetical protein